MSGVTARASMNERGDLMRNRSAFGGCHPLVNLLYFCAVIGFSMFFKHPAVPVVSLFGAAWYYIKLKGRGAARFLLKYTLPVSLLAAVINAAFNHRGATILCYLPTGNPLTLESIAYGLAAAVMFAAVLTWFGCFSEIMTSDKFVYLFGRITPSLSLVLSMTLRFAPRFARQFERVKEARLCLGEKPRGAFGRLKNAFVCFSVMTSWALEGSIITADSMKSRGFGLRGRTAFSLYRFTERDLGVLAWLGLCLMFLISGALSGGFNWRFFPRMRGDFTEPLTLALELVYLAVCVTPAVIDIWEDRQWSLSRSKM